MLKFAKLKKILRELKSVVIAFSGGLDSTFLLKVAVDTLGKDKVIAVIARSETYPEWEYKEALGLSKKIGAKCVTIHTKELAIKNFKDNPVNRCYYCKKELFKSLHRIKELRGFTHLIDGANFDDLKDVRYGMKAARELGVRSPLLEARVTKGEIRRHSKRLKLPTWDKPSFACLASRFPFNNRITKRALSVIDAAESSMREMGFRQVRVRKHGDIARIEIFREDFPRLLKRDPGALIRRLKKLGFKYVSLDLEGYRTGSMHEAIKN